jgi:hypothetical protein
MGIPPVSKSAPIVRIVLSCYSLDGVVQNRKYALFGNYLRFQVSVADALRVTVLHTLHQLTEIKPGLQSRTIHYRVVRYIDGSCGLNGFNARYGGASHVVLWYCAQCTALYLLLFQFPLARNFVE